MYKNRNVTTYRRLFPINFTLSVKNN